MDPLGVTLDEVPEEGRSVTCASHAGATDVHDVAPLALDRLLVLAIEWKLPDWLECLITGYL